MIHQVLGGAQGQATDVEIEARHMLDIKHRLNTLMAANVGKSVEEVTRDTERNNWMFPQEALEYGLIDKILED
jgi:ATP-dependent Clp protease protease subunit